MKAIDCDTSLIQKVDLIRTSFKGDKGSLGKFVGGCKVQMINAASVVAHLNL